MGREPDEHTSPDLFSPPEAGDASPPPPSPPAPEATAEPAPQRHVLPKNLRKAVKHLSDEELDLLHAATIEEMKRRGRIPPSVAVWSKSNSLSLKCLTAIRRFFGRTSRWGAGSAVASGAGGDGGGELAAASEKRSGSLRSRPMT